MVTGGSSGSGREIAWRLAKQGHLVVSGARSFSSDLDGQWGRPGDEPREVHLDVTSERSCHALFESMRLRDVGVEVLVNNAASLVVGPLEHMGNEEIEQMVATNLVGPLRVTRLALPMLRVHNGRIVNVSSLAGAFGLPLYSVYCATKFALEGLSESLRNELIGVDVRVVTVRPGYFESGMRAASRTAAAYNRRSPYAESLGATHEVQTASARRAPSSDDIVAALERACLDHAPPDLIVVGRDAQFLHRFLRESPERARAFLYHTVLKLPTRERTAPSETVSRARNPAEGSS